MCALMVPTTWKLLLAVLVCFRGASAVYLPGLAPNEYDQGATVDLKVNKLTSAKNQLPYGYYTLPFCPPPAGKKNVGSLGETLMGDKIENSPYEIQLPVNKACTFLCERALSKTDKEDFRAMIDDEYKVNWIVDGLPAASVGFGGAEFDDRVYTEGFLVGFSEKGHYYLNNHVTITLLYHSNVKMYDGFRIVGFVVVPRSIVQTSKAGDDTDTSCSSKEEGKAVTRFDLDAHNEIKFTYDVQWQWSEIRWASRWDAYLQVRGGHIHWFSILNSVVVLLLLSAMVAMILVRTLRRDIVHYNRESPVEDIQEDVGWKLIHGDVFRKPNHSTILSVSVGAGMQILGMCIVTIISAMLGLLSPARRGQLLQCMVLLYTVMGGFAGYTSARLCKVFDGDGARWKLTTLLTAIIYPGICFLVFFVLNLFIWSKESSGAVPFATLVAIVVLWFGVSVPLVFLGAHLGFRKPVIELPVKVNQIPREIEKSPLYAKTYIVSLSSGVIPFCAVFTELFFIMDSIWGHRYYYLFGFLIAVMAILLVICAEISIAIVYNRLTFENHQWWWLAFYSSASSGLYVFGYSVFYFATQTHIDKIVPTILYFGYMGLASMMFALLTGSIGFLASFMFVRTIYGSIKVE